MPNITAVQLSSASTSRAAMPSSIAWPMTAGITACATIQTMPNSMPITKVCHWPFISQTR